MVRRVSDHVGQRVLDEIKHLSVKLGIRPDHLQIDLLIKFVRQIANNTWQLLPGIANRLHPRLHNSFLQLRRHVGKALQWNLELALIQTAYHFKELISGQHQFRNHRHQVFKRINIHANRLCSNGTFFFAAFVL